MGIFEPEDDECCKKPKIRQGTKMKQAKGFREEHFPNEKVDYLEEAHKRELAMQQRMFKEADLHRQEYQKLLFKHTKLEVEHRSSLNEISLLRRLVRALYDQDKVEENEVRKEMEKEYVTFR